MIDRQLALVLDASRPVLRPESLCDEEERAVAAALRWGRAGARRIPSIAQATGIPGRRVQELVDHLIHEHRWPIGTSMSEPFGNYLIDSAEDLEQTVTLLRTRGISNLSRAAALKGMSIERYLQLVQTDLGIGHRN